MFGNGSDTPFMDKIHGRLSVHVFTHGYGSMDDMVQIGIAVVDIDAARYKTGFNKVPFLFGQFRFSGILLQYDQVAAHFRTRIGKQIVRQTDGRNEIGMVYQPLPDGTVLWRVHDARSRDIGQYPAFAQRIHAFEKEIVVYGSE